MPVEVTEEQKRLDKEWMERVATMFGKRLLSHYVKHQGNALAAALEIARYLEAFQRLFDEGEIPSTDRIKGCEGDCTVSDFNGVLCNVEPEMVEAVHAVAKMLEEQREQEQADGDLEGYIMGMVGEVLDGMGLDD